MSDATLVLALNILAMADTSPRSTQLPQLRDVVNAAPAALQQSDFGVLARAAGLDPQALRSGIRRRVPRGRRTLRASRVLSMLVKQ